MQFNPIEKAVNIIVNMVHSEQYQELVDEEIDPGIQYVDTVEDLPLEGMDGVQYHVVTEGTDWCFRDNAYYETRYYVTGIDSKYFDALRVIRRNPIITDYFAEIGSISIEQVRDGQSPVMAALYNLQAFKADLDMIRRLDITDRRTSLMDVLSRGPSNNAQYNLLDWFSREHKALYTLLKSSARSKQKLYQPMLEALGNHNAILGWDTANDSAYFKVDDFKVYL